MEFLEDILEPHKEKLAAVAGTVTALQFLSGIFMLNDIRKAGSSKNFPLIPFLGGLTITILSLKFGTLIRDDAMIKVNLFGFVLNIIYVCLYYWYTPNSDKTKVWAKLGLAIILCAGCILYAEYEDPSKVELRFGLLVTVFLIFLVGSPLLSLKEIFETKSTGNLPFPIILSGTIVSASWLLYGISIRNELFVQQNFALLSLGVLELYLFILFPNKKAQIKKKKN